MFSWRTTPASHVHWLATPPAYTLAIDLICPVVVDYVVPCLGHKVKVAHVVQAILAVAKVAQVCGQAVFGVLFFHAVEPAEVLDAVELAQGLE